MTSERTDFATLTRPGTPNTYLIAPEGLCRQAKIDAVAPVFDVPAARLRQELLGIIIAEPRSSHTLADEQALYDDFVVRSAVFGFPDLISVKFLDVKGGKSTLALYSRSVYGRWDLGVNRTRAQAWLKRLTAAVKPVKT
jgi:uncharacterized protein (DUF1499 family)